MFSSRSILTGLFALGFAADPAFAAPDIFYQSDSPAEACAAGVAIPGEATPGLKRICEKALDQPMISPRDKAATLANSGIVSLRFGEFETARLRLQQARELAPDNGDISISLAAALIRLERTDEAIAVLSETDSITPERLHLAYYNRALAHWARDVVEDAYRDFYTSAALKPGFAPAETALAQFQVASTE
jgi:tetratricopeptide (TPR) repeat protein